MSILFKRNELLLITIVMLLFFLRITFSMEPPRPGEIEKYQKDGSLSKRVEYAKKIGNYKVSSDLVKRKIEQMKALQEGRTFNPETFPYATGLPSSGSPKIFILLIDFPDYPHTNSESIIDDKIFGYGHSDEQPYESLIEYYYRSSYGFLNIQGNVLAWYRESHNRGYYSTYEQMIEEALNYHNPTHNFAQYDNNGDGIIDYFAVFWTGPNTGWGTFWWGYCCGWGDPTYTIDGKSLRTYSWQWEADPPGTEFYPRVLMHETSHGLGLPDYYDYDDSVGPKGGLGGLDMMDANKVDHNGFSKWLLEWNTPTVIGTSEPIQTIYLRSSSDFQDCVIIMPGQTISQPFREYYVVQNRSRLNQQTNGYKMPTDGLLIWHVDATLNDTYDNFRYDNSYSAHKLIRLMEADGKEEIEQNQAADAGDMYTQNEYFSPLTIPNSNYYSGSRTGVHILDVNPTLLFSFFRANFVISGLDLVSISEAVDNFSLPWSYGGNQVWFGQKLTSLYGGDSAQSRLLSDNQSGYIFTTVTGPGTLKFHWKVSSEANGDYLEFYIDDVLQSRISGEVNWQQRTYNISSGSHTAKWTYKKDVSSWSGSDRAWVDRVRFEMGSLANGLDNFNLNWSTRGDVQWFYETTDYYYGGDAVQSGAISDTQVSFLETSVSGPGTVTFYWRVSCQWYWDYLGFWVDGTYIADISTEVDWEQRSFHVNSGLHYLVWAYIKDSAFSDYQDCGWVDKVEWTPSATFADPYFLYE